MGKRDHVPWQERLLVVSQENRKGYAGLARSAFEDRLRVRLLLFISMTFVAILSARLLYLQVFAAQEHSLLSEGNHIEQQMEIASRGAIRDTNDLVLAEGTGPERRYPLGVAAAHLVGYMAEATPDEIGCSEGVCYNLGSYVGRAGAERLFERTLKGKNGGRVVEVDAGGAVVRELGSNQAEPGTDIQLSIDSRLQSAIAAATDHRVGAVVALDLSGHVLGLYSSPSFDPLHVSLYLQDTSKQYFLNRATSGIYPPGSVFKLVTAYAGLDSGEITADTLIEDTGEITIDQYRYGNWYFDQYGRTEGQLTLERALARSNDIFFYKTGELVGVDSLVRLARTFGLGHEAGIELAPESGGFVPDRLWRERLTGERWSLGNTYHLAIGQGDLLVTPLQVARMTAAAVSGRLCTVSILKDTEIACDDLGLEAGDMEIVKAGMRAACSPGGTAFPFFDFVPGVLCKTGTAQHGAQKDMDDEPHAWITVAYPADNPTIVLTVLLEAAGEGSYEAGPVAREILSAWRDLGK